MPYEIVIDPSQPFQDSATDLDEVEYLLRVKYSQREDRYYVSLYLNDGTPVLLGLKVVCNVGLFRSYSLPNLPPGDLLAVSNTNDTSPPKLGELGLTSDQTRVQLLYYTKADLDGMISDEVAELVATAPSSSTFAKLKVIVGLLVPLP